ncbi:30S ribosomal protein S6 [Patescibacteria group bacterium]|nr:30S ribosomal protein S6 [Patescibacteria group bacterium]
MAEAEINKKTYELTVIISSDLSEFDAGKAVDKLKTSIINKGGEIINTSDWGKRKLAYLIKGNEFGFYQTIVFNLLPDAVATLTRELELDQTMLRHILVSLEKEGVTVDQLFNPEKEELMMAAAVKEKMAPTIETRKFAAKPAPKPVVPAEPTAETQKPESTDNDKEPTPEAISKEELDQKIEEALKADLE